MIVQMIVTMSLFINALLIHELGHLITGTKYSKYTNTKWVNRELHTYLSDDVPIKNRIKMVSNGIIAGYFALIPILLYSGSIMFILLSLVYTWGCAWDFKLIKRLKNDI